MKSQVLASAMCLLLLASCSSVEQTPNSRTLYRYRYHLNLGGTSTIVGQVRSLRLDQPIAGASVFIVGGTNGCITDSNGNYAIQGIVEGVRKVTVSFIGLKKGTSDTLHLGPNEISIIDFQLADTSIHIDVDVWY